MKKLILLLVLFSLPLAQAKSVAIVASFPDNSSQSACVQVSNNTNAYQGIEKTGWNLSWSYSDQYGHALCKIEDTGCPSGDCFCSEKYWNFLIQRENWSYSQVGFDSYSPEDGEVIGLAYGKHGITPGNVSFKEVCGKNKSLAESPTVLDSLFSPYSLVVVFVVLLAFYVLISYVRKEK